MTRSKTTSPKPRAVLKRGKARHVWAGHPWIFSGALQRVEGDDLAPGCVVEVVDHRQQPIGVGTYNPTARIAVRMLGKHLPDGGVEALIHQRVREARALRARFGLPNDQTTAFRLLNGEGDGLPGVICDQLGDLASIQLTTAAAEQWRPWILDAVNAPVMHVHVPADSARMEGLSPGERFGRGDHEAHVDLKENGITWRLKPGKGQKTGFYTDQRENRRLIAELSKGKTVLDCCCYTGGFALNAARGGAQTVIGVDSSGPAVSVASGTAELNGLDQVKFLREDTMRYLKGADSEGFDVVVLDPPKFARTQQGLDEAYRKYRAWNVEAMRKVRSNGLFASCSCSSRVDEQMFVRMLTDAAHRADRHLRIQVVRGAGPDHLTPSAFDEGRYLTFVLGVISE